MGIGMLLFWGLIIFGIIMLVRGFGGISNAGEPRALDRTPLDILGERYARSEIDKAEFEQKRSDLVRSATLPTDKQRRGFLKTSGAETP